MGSLQGFPIVTSEINTLSPKPPKLPRIRIRATTIRDFDGKELLVHNKEFISGRLLNWSLSYPVLRIVLPVGVAYGSDVAVAMQLMRQAAEQHSLVLDEPKPVVTFDSFGDNALQLNLRCFIGSLDEIGCECVADCIWPLIRPFARPASPWPSSSGMCIWTRWHR